MSPKRDCGSKGVNPPKGTFLTLSEHLGEPWARVILVSAFFPPSALGTGVAAPLPILNDMTLCFVVEVLRAIRTAWSLAAAAAVAMTAVLL